MPDCRTCNVGADRNDAAGETLGQSQHVGDDALYVAGEERAATAEAGLHFVGDQERSILVAEFARFREITGGREVDAAFALQGLDDEGGGIRERRCERACVAVRDVDDVGNQRSVWRLERSPSADR